MQWVVVLLSVLVASTFQKTQPTNNGFFTWNGFEYIWERTVPLTGLHYGHKLGNLEAQLEGQQHTISDNGEWTGKVTASMTFTPGADGDIAHPSVYYSAAFSPKVVLTPGHSYSFQFTDLATRDSNESQSVYADSSYTIPISLPIPAGFDQYDAILNGFSLEMACDPEKQPQGICDATSSSIWPSTLQVDIMTCSKLNSVTLSCTLAFEISRTTPPGDIPDDFNWAVDYTVFVSFSTIAANTSDANFVASPQLVVERSGTHSDVIHDRATITTTGRVRYDQAFVTLRGFGFQLSNLLIPHDGRNLYAYTFYVRNEQYNVTQSSSGIYTSQLLYTYAMGAQSSDLTAPSNTKLWHRTGLIQLANYSTPYETTVVADQSVQGTVCQSEGVIFQCIYYGVPFDHTHTTEKISVQANVNP